jgi:L-histidine N-alpha-methyltransferase
MLDAEESMLGPDVLDGLTRAQKELPPKYFYDARGAELFDQICDLPEYYPTRCERAILSKYARDIAELTDAAELLELGSGTASKTRVLLTAMAEHGTLRRYLPVDVTDEMILRTAEELVEEYPGLHVHGTVGDFERHLGEFPAPEGPRLVVFLGGTIGNFAPASRRRFLKAVARMMNPEDTLLLGTDLVKAPAVIEAAYNDSLGVTAEFNRNVLHVLNTELDADFDPEGFDHVAFFNTEQQWIEMRLRAREAHTVRVGALALDVQFEAGEEIRTEISAKFTRERLAADLASAGLELQKLYTDDEERFAVSLSRVA